MFYEQLRNGNLKEDILMPLYKMSELAPAVMAEINAIIKLAGTKEKRAKRATVNALRVKRARQMELRLQQTIRRR